MTSLPCHRPRGRKSWAWAAPLAWLVAGAALLLLATVAVPPRLTDEPPLFWIGQARPLPSPLTPPHAPGHGHAAPPAAGEGQP